jgi:hypothetical protein
LRQLESAPLAHSHGYDHGRHGKLTFASGNGHGFGLVDYRLGSTGEHDVRFHSAPLQFRGNVISQRYDTCGLFAIAAGHILRQDGERRLHQMGWLARPPFFASHARSTGEYGPAGWRPVQHRFLRLHSAVTDKDAQAASERPRLNTE